MRRVIFEGRLDMVEVGADANQESVMFPIIGNPLESFSVNLISILDQPVFCMTATHSLCLRGFVEYQKSALCISCRHKAMRNYFKWNELDLSNHYQFVKQTKTVTFSPQMQHRYRLATI